MGLLPPESSPPQMICRDRHALLFTINPFDSPVGGRVYAARFDGGEPRLLLRNASEASWAR